MRRFFLGLVTWLWTSAAWANVPCTLPFNLQNNTTADATQVMANYNALVTCLGNAAAAGSNSDITALLGLTTPILPASGGSSVYVGGTSTGSANAQVVAAPSPNGFSLAAGKQILFISGFANTGAMTLNVNSSGATAVTQRAGGSVVPLLGGEIGLGVLVQAIYDGTQYELISVTNLRGGFGASTNIVSATTTDLSLAVNHNALITGTTTITGFGSNASTDYPTYAIKFNGILTLTYNAASLITPGAGNIVTAANDTAVVQYLGSGNWQIISYTRAAGTAVVNPTPLCGANGLSITNNAGTPNTNIDVTADSVVLINPTGNVPIYRTSVSVTINDTTTGANGLDAGSLANNTFYHHYLIDNGTTTAGLDSTSATSPTMPSGYTYRCRLGASKTNGSANFYRFLTTGNETQYIVDGTILVSQLAPVSTGGGVGSNCVQTSPTFVSTTIRGASGAAPIWVPTTATDVRFVGYSYNANLGVVVAPNANYRNIGANTPGGFPLYCSNISTTVCNATIKLESNAISLCSDGASGALYVQSYREKVNAN